MALSFHRHLSELKIDIDLSFSYQNISVRTITNKELLKYWTEGRKDKNYKSDKYLLLEASTEIEEYDSLGEGAANIRPMVLAFLGLLTFLTDEVFTIYDFNSIQSFVIKEPPKPIVTRILTIDQVDKSPLLVKILEFLEKSDNARKELVYSLFDRYRKAKYMVNEDEDGMRFDDEIFLAYFHILELLAQQYDSALKTNLKNATKNFLLNFFTDVYLFDTGKAIEETNAKQKLIEQLFTVNIPVAAKIGFMHKQLGMFTGKSRHIVETYVKFRNDIAHGQAVYKGKLQFPLPPFFSQVQDIAEEINVISLLAIRTIDAYIGADLYKSEWDSLIKYYPAPYEQIKEFLTKKEYENITVLSFKQGRVKGIAPWMLTYYYVIKKGRLNNYEAAIKSVILSLRLNKRDALNYLEPCILLSDSLDEALRNKCQQIIANAYKMNFPEIRARDYLKNFEYHRFKLVWFKNFVGNYLNTAKAN